MGGLGPLDWPTTLGKMEGELDARLDGVRRHEATYAALLRPAGGGRDGAAAAILRQPPAGELRMVAAARAEVEAADVVSAPEEVALRRWLAAYREWAEKLGAEP